MIVACWNIRGFSTPLKHNGVKHLIKKHAIDVLGLLETKISMEKLQWIMYHRFPNWMQVNNFSSHGAGRILVIWNPMKVSLVSIETNAQAMHCKISCNISKVSFFVSFIYGFHSIVARRPLWENLKVHGSQLMAPWMVLGDFNNVLHDGERVNGADISSYEVRDFSDCCQQVGLSDLQSLGCRLTWTNGRVWSKIDRVLVNHYWLQEGHYGSAHFWPSGCLSDHSPVIVSLFDNFQSSRKPFRFLNMWADHSDFQGLVGSTWSSNVLGTKQFQLCKKLKSLKVHLKQLNKKNFSHISERANRADQALMDAQIALQNLPSNEQLRCRVVELKKEAKFLAEAERHFYGQLAKCSYLNKSDRNSKFFHGLMKRNAKRNFIASVIKRDGLPTSSQHEVASEFIEFYKGLLGTNSVSVPIDPTVLNSGSKVSWEQANVLSRTVTRDEIKEALFSIGEDKSPGPDGFTSCFFKKSWNIVGDLLCDAVLEFFESTSLLKQVNHSAIVLIPKTAHSSSVQDFRPISCCNITYKVISKVLAGRLSSILPSLVDQAQSAFVKGRSMVDNIHLAQELLRNYNRKRVSPRWMAKVDIKKAYDTVSWSFLNGVLSCLGFPSCFVGWIMECISSPSYSLVINGALHGFFKGKRGLRQGDPLSPFLFVLCLEYFSRSIKLATDIPNFNFHPKCGKLKITHLAFADDLILFARGDVLSIKIILDCLARFGAHSGLCVNQLKSSMFTAGLRGNELEEIKSLANFPIGAMPFRYLGIPLAAERLKVVHYAPILDKIADYISSWKCSSLSYAGRTELIRSILQGVECFWLSILPVPASVIDKLIRLCRVFLWNSQHSLVSWKDVSLPKAEGGLGLKELRSWNSVLLIKVLWNFHKEKDALWVRWVHQNYLNGSSIWTWVPNKRDSPLLKRIFALRDILCQKEGSVEHATARLLSWGPGESLSLDKVYDYFRPRGHPTAWANVIWKSAIVPKHSIILWLGAKDKLLTRDKLIFLDTDKSCGMCGISDESSQHIFFQCTISLQIWGHIKEWMGIRRYMPSLASGLRWLKRDARGSSWLCKAKKIAFASTVYHLWTARNYCIFEGQAAVAESIISRVKSDVYRVIFSLYPYALTYFETLAIGL